MSSPASRLAIRTFPIVFAAPSGAGKTSIARGLQARRQDVEFSISATTRPPRPTERDAVDYHFRSETAFRRMIEDGELLEWAEVHGCLYGTPSRNLEEARRRHHFLLLDIDVQGSRQVKAAIPEAVSIFVLPPSGRELARRLVGRGSEDGAVQRKRLRAAREEIGAAREFDYVVVNDELEVAVASVERILLAESLRASRNAGLDHFIAELVRDVDQVLGSQ